MIMTGDARKNDSASESQKHFPAPVFGAGFFARKTDNKKHSIYL